MSHSLVLLRERKIRGKGWKPVLRLFHRKIFCYQEMRKTSGSRVEVSPRIFWAQCSTQWPSTQHLCSIIQPNYHLSYEEDDRQMEALLSLIAAGNRTAVGRSARQGRSNSCSMNSVLHPRLFFRWGRRICAPKRVDRPLWRTRVIPDAAQSRRLP